MLVSNMGNAAAAEVPAAWLLSGHLDLDSMVVLSGGASRHASSSALLQAGGSFDTAAAGLWTGGRFDVSLEGVLSSGDPAASVGAVQIPSNEWAPNFARIYQLTYQHDMGSAWVRLGVMDLNQAFESSDLATLLHNSSDGMSPGFMANANVPSFPNPGLCAMVNAGLGAGWTARAGVWQGDPPGWGRAFHRGGLLITEVQHDWLRGDAVGSDIKLGVWRAPGTSTAAGQPLTGVYGMGETRWQVGASTWGGFVLVGTQPAAQAGGSYAGVGSFVGAGLLLQGLLPGRAQDQASVGVNRVTLAAGAAETQVELVYAWQLSKALSLQPDVQWIRHPGGIFPDAWVAGARLSLGF